MEKPPDHCDLGRFCYILHYMNRLTKQEQLVLCIVFGLLLTGWAVKAYRTAHPPVQTQLPAHPEQPPAAANDQAEH
jgi:hypothetical protein